MSYRVNEVFYSLQGEGARAGSPNVFVRFAGCNLTCRRDVEGFDCDTEFTSGRTLELLALLEEANDVRAAALAPCGVILTGGEPGLQVDAALVRGLIGEGFSPIAIETNGTVDVSGVGLQWISCSPKTAEHTLKLSKVDELRYVRRKGMGIPKPIIKADHLYISPAYGVEGIDVDDLAWCVRLVKENPAWKLSVHQLKGWGLR
jgi:7-carboxy-7-deazaguanine synthase